MHETTKESGGGLVAIIALVAIAAVGGVWFMSSSGTDTQEEPAAALLPTNTNTSADETRLAGDPELESMDDADMASDGMAMPLPDHSDVDEMIVEEVSDPLPLAAGTWEAYSPEKLALAETGDVVLFFHANWCPSCRALESDITANLSNIPDGVHLLRVDYDTETELKKKYGIVRQHTLVHVNANGDKIKDLTGLNNTLAQVVSQI